MQTPEVAEDEHNDTECNPVVNKNESASGLKVAHQPCDRDETKERGDNDANRKWQFWSEGKPSLAMSINFFKTAPPTMGADSRKEYCAGAFRVIPRNKPAMIVTPERDTPGIIANMTVGVPNS